MPLSQNRGIHFPFYGWVILAASFALATVAFGIHYSFGVFLKPLQDEFLTGRTSISGIFSTYFIVMVITGILAGWASDRMGPRIILVSSGFVAFVGLVLSSRADTLWQLYVSYGLILGLGLGSAMPVTMAIVSRWFMKRRGLALGILTAGMSFGMMIMPPMVQNLIARYEWRASMFILGIAVLGMYALAGFLMRKEPQMMGLLPYGVTIGNDSSDTRNETSRPTPSPRSHSTLKEAIKTKELWLLMGMFCSFAVSVQMVTSHVVRYALDVGISASQAPLIISIIGGGGMVGKIMAGALSERIGPKRIIIICALIMAGTVICLSNMTSIWTFFAFAVPFGLAYGGWMPNISILIAEIFGTAHYGEIWATARVGGGLGGIVGPMLAGYVFDITNSYRAAFWSGAGITLLAIMFTVLLMKRRQCLTSTSS